jgi:hypothetical protein
MTMKNAPRGKQMPKSNALPLGQRRAKTQKPAAQKRAAEEQTASQEAVDTATDDVVSSPQVETITVHDEAITPQQQEKMMTLTLKTLNKKGNQAYYSGAAQVVRFAIGLFPGKQAPASIEVPEGTFVGPKVSTPKVKMTPEERKAAAAARPKPTLAERAAKAKERADKLAAQLAGATAL